MVIIFIRLNVQNHVFWHAAVVETFHVAHIGRAGGSIQFCYIEILVYYLLPRLPSLGQGDQQQKKAKSQLLRLSPLSKKSCVCHNVRKDRRKATAALARAFTTQFFA